MAVAFPQKASWTERRKVGNTMEPVGIRFPHNPILWLKIGTSEDLWVL